MAGYQLSKGKGICASAPQSGSKEDWGDRMKNIIVALVLLIVIAGARDFLGSIRSSWLFPWVIHS
jgi:hypothetical protein